MEKIDIFMGILGIIAYFSIFSDLRNCERDMARYEMVQEKRRKQAQLKIEQRQAEIARKKSIQQQVEDSLSPQKGTVASEI